MTNSWRLLTPISGQCTTAVTAPSLAFKRDVGAVLVFYLFIFTLGNATAAASLAQH